MDGVVNVPRPDSRTAGHSLVIHRAVKTVLGLVSHFALRQLLDTLRMSTTSNVKLMLDYSILTLTDVCVSTSYKADA